MTISNSCAKEVRIIYNIFTTSVPQLQCWNACFVCGASGLDTRSSHTNDSKIVLLEREFSTFGKGMGVKRAVLPDG